MEIAPVSKEILSVLRGALTQDRVYIPYSAQAASALQQPLNATVYEGRSRFHPYKLYVFLCEVFHMLVFTMVSEDTFWDFY